MRDLRELLGFLVLVALVQLSCELRQALLEPPALGLERQGVGVAVGQRALEAGKGRRSPFRIGLGEQLVDLLEKCGYSVGCQSAPLNDYRRATPRRTRAARPISNAGAAYA